MFPRWNARFTSAPTAAAPAEPRDLSPAARAEVFNGELRESAAESAVGRPTRYPPMGEGLTPEHIEDLIEEKLLPALPGLRGLLDEFASLALNLVDDVYPLAAQNFRHYLYGQGKVRVLTPAEVEAFIAHSESGNSLGVAYYEGELKRAALEWAAGAQPGETRAFDLLAEEAKLHPADVSIEDGWLFVPSTTGTDTYAAVGGARMFLSALATAGEGGAVSLEYRWTLHDTYVWLATNNSASLDIPNATVRGVLEFIVAAMERLGFAEGYRIQINELDDGRAYAVVPDVLLAYIQGARPYEMVGSSELRREQLQAGAVGAEDSSYG